MSKIEVNTIDVQCGSTLTLGSSGKTVAIASGASTTGMGRAGAVDWQTTKKTTAFTAVNGEGYFVDTAASGAVTMTLPSSPSAGNIVAVKDYNGNFGTANLTIGRNGSPINGASAADVTINTDGASIVLVYVDATQGWVATQDDSSTFAGDSFIVATGGTITTCGNDKIHTFTGPGTFTVCSVSNIAANNIVSHVVVAGGGGASYDRSGGGGAGGYREVKNPVNSYTASPLDGYPSAPNRVTVSATSYPITIGAGGTADNSSPYGDGGDGANSVFSTITSAGGGGGGRNNSNPNGVDGGSGGGAGSIAPHTGRSGGAGNTPPVSPPQGNPGGNSANTSPGYATGGGGGAGAAGGDASGPCAGAGGAGTTSSINGTPTARAGGGGGGSDNAGDGGAAGSGGGGAGGTPPSEAAAGTANTGGGAGGTSGSSTGANANNGGSGVVIIRYKYQ